MNKIKKVSTFIMFNNDQIVVDFERNDEKPPREYRPSAFAAGLLADVIWDMVYAGEVRMRPFIQTEVDAWGWDARIK